MKTCRACGLEKPITEFSKQPRLRGGIRNQCKQCHNLKRAKRRADPVKRRAELDRDKGYRSTDEYRTRQAAAAKRRRNADPEAFNSQRRDYYAKNLKSDRILLTEQEKKDRARAACRRHWANNRQRYRTNTLNYLARKRGAAGTHTDDDVAAQLLRQGYACFWCQADISDGWEEDHFIPLSRGGTNDAFNIVCTCTFCNRSKGSKMPDEFRAYRALASGDGISDPMAGTP